MNIINLPNLELKTFTEQDVSDYCLLNDINPDNIIELYLRNNELTDISGIKLFKNLEYLHFNKIKNISVLKYLVNLKELNIGDNEIKDIRVLKDLINLKWLYINNNKVSDISVLKYLNKLKYLDLRYLELESDLFKYIKNLNNLKDLWCYKGFKDMSIINQLNRNINIIVVK